MENEFEVVEVEEEEEEEEKEDGGGEKKFEDSIVRFSRPLAWVLGNNWWPKAPSSSSSSPPSPFFPTVNAGNWLPADWRWVPPLPSQRIAGTTTTYFDPFDRRLSKRKRK